MNPTRSADSAGGNLEGCRDYSRWSLIRGRPVFNVYVAAAVLLAVVVGLFALRHTVVTLRYPYPVEYGEGVVANWIRAVDGGHALYPAVGDSAPFLHNPYPPLFYRMAAVAGKLAGKPGPFIVPRAFSAISFFICALVIFAIVRAREPVVSAWAAAGLFALSPVVLRYSVMARVDLTALAYALAGLYVLDRYRSRPIAAALPGFLCACAFLVKPLYVVPVAAGLIVCFGRGWKHGTTFLCAVIAVTVVGLVPDALRNGAMAQHLLVLNRLPLEPGTAFSLFAETAGRHAVILAAIPLLLWHREAGRSPAWWYAALAPAGLFFAAKTGAEQNYHLELIAMSSIACGLVSGRFRAGGLLPAVFAAQMILYLPIEPAPVFTRTYEQELVSTGSSTTLSRENCEMGRIITAELRAAGDPVLCEDIGYLILADRTITLQPYQFVQLAKSGRWDDSMVVDMIRSRVFRLVVIGSDPETESSPYFTDRMLDAIRENYLLGRTEGKYRLYLPAGE